MTVFVTEPVLSGHRPPPSDGDTMPLQNRVTPEGEIIAHPGRGLFMGNRGCLHDDQRRIVRPFKSIKLWITCRVKFNDRRRTLMAPGHYTELFFLDEAVSLAAGHRPCGECRRADYVRYREAWARAHGGALPFADAMNIVLDQARLDRKSGRQVTFVAPLDTLPDGTFIRYLGDSPPLLVHGGQLHPYDAGGYRDPVARATGVDVIVLTPKPNVAVLAAGYRPVVHQSAS